LCPPTAEDEAANKRVLAELVVTVDALTRLGAFSALGTMRTDPAFAKVPRGPEQLYLDLVGDSAHALRGLDLATGRDGDLLRFRADSDSAISKGNVALLLRLYSGRAPTDILAFDAKGALDRLGLPQALTRQRANGLNAMVGRIRAEAMAAG
jgi:hypothetical protein